MTNKQTLEKIEKLVLDVLEEVREKNSYTHAYRGLVEVRNIIFDNDPKHLVGRYGYFWDNKDVCEFGKLVTYDECHAYPYSTKKNQWKNFSLNVPEHCK